MFGHTLQDIRLLLPLLLLGGRRPGDHDRHLAVQEDVIGDAVGEQRGGHLLVVMETGAGE